MGYVILYVGKDHIGIMDLWSFHSGLGFPRALWRTDMELILLAHVSWHIHKGQKHICAYSSLDHHLWASPLVASPKATFKELYYVQLVNCIS